MGDVLEIFAWNDKYDTGIETIDRQHRKLVQLLNLLFGHLALQSDAPTLNSVFEQLKDYTVLHFREEEQLWSRHFGDDPWLAEHHATHAEFIGEILRLKADEATRPLESVLSDIVSFLTHWLAFHILDSDRRLAHAVLAIEAGSPLQQAKALAVEQMSGATKVLIETLMNMSDTLASRTVQLGAEMALRQRAEHVAEAARERAEAARLQAEAANLAKSSFLASMSHEIRTPLAAITGMVYKMQRAGVSPEQAEQLRIIDDAGRHLLRVINDILDLSKIEAGKLTLEEAPLDVATIMNNVASLLADRASERKLRMVVETAPLAHRLLGDRTRLQQALLNYAGNAIKFTAAGSIVLRSNVVEEADDHAVLRFEVEDSGIGIEASALERLFTSFEQAETSTTRNYGGTGLGLVITRRLARLMGGDAGATSTPGVGSRFWFTVRLKTDRAAPASRQAVAPESPDTVLQRDFRDTPVLVVDDDPINREIAQLLLEEVGFTVHTAANGMEAIEKIVARDYRLVLMDMQMPVMDGLEATTHIRRLPRGESIPVIAMTANAFTEDRQRCLAAGMNDFLTKPVEPERLYETILNWLLPGG